jgi:phage FluMu gp28-like protein
MNKVLEFYGGQASTEKIPSDALKKLSLELKNGSRIIALPGTEKTLRGFRAAMVIVDEAARVEEDLIHAVSPMLAVTGGTLMLLSTPAGQTGYFYEAWTSGLWSRHMVTATEVPRITPEFLESEKLTMPDRLFRQEYFCSWEAAPGAVFSASQVEAAFTDEITPIVIPSKVFGPERTTDILEQVLRRKEIEEAS